MQIKIVYLKQTILLCQALIDDDRPRSRTETGQGVVPITRRYALRSPATARPRYAERRFRNIRT